MSMTDDLQSLKQIEGGCWNDQVSWHGILQRLMVILYTSDIWIFQFPSWIPTEHLLSQQEVSSCKFGGGRILLSPDC